MSILEQIEAVVNDMTDNNTPSQLITVIKGYDEKVCDIETKNGVLKNIPCSTIASNGDEGLLVYPNGDANKPFVLLFTGGGGGDLSNYYTKSQINAILSSYVTSQTLEDYQPLLESGENIKTINGESLLGQGDISISGTVSIATSWGDPLSDEKVPSEKLVKDTLDDKVDYDELHNLDINLTTLELVPKNTNPNGVICFDDLQNKYIEKSNTSGLVKNDGTIDTTQYLSSLPSHNHDDRYYTKSEVVSALNGKQATLVSGTNIKTINNNSLLGSGNIDIQGGGGSVIGTGSFSINNQGHLIVELPNAVDNPYFIDNNGHLIYDTSNTHNGE